MHDEKKESYLVLGLGKSGLTTIRFLQQTNRSFLVNDGANEADCPIAPLLREEGVSVVFGSHPLSLLDHVTCVVKTPGIPYTNPILVEAGLRNIPVITEIELAYHATTRPIIAITGSNGKTTTTSLVGEMLSHASYETAICGNIGTPFLEVAHQTQPDWFVAEVSSFQLKGTQTFRPKIAAFLNFAETHLDYHGTNDDYLRSKARIFANQKSGDYAVLNADDAICVALSLEIDASCYFFSRTQQVPQGAYIREGAIYLVDQGQEHYVLPVSAIPLQGAHNVENVLASVLIAYLAGVAPDKLAQAVTTFQAIEHRLEHVATHHDIQYINDSKATNPMSTIKACEAFTTPLVLLVGGKDRGSDIHSVLPTLKQQSVRAVLAFGETKNQWAAIAKEAGVPIVDTTDDVSSVVERARKISEKGDTVLFSPGCASWGMYPSYIERGEHFKSLVKQFTSNKTTT